MHVPSPIFQGQLIEKIDANFNGLGDREGWKKCQKEGKIMLKIFFRRVPYPMH